MSPNFRPGHPDYVIFPPPHASGASNVAIIETVVTAVIGLLETGASIAREDAQRAAIESESKRRVEEFRTSMALLEKQLGLN